MSRVNNLYSIYVTVPKDFSLVKKKLVFCLPKVQPSLNNSHKKTKPTTFTEKGIPPKKKHINKTVE